MGAELGAATVDGFGIGILCLYIYIYIFIFIYICVTANGLELEYCVYIYVTANGSFALIGLEKARVASHHRKHQTHVLLPRGASPFLLVPSGAHPNNYYTLCALARFAL
jgi:hypothetical protein